MTADPGVPRWAAAVVPSVADVIFLALLVPLACGAVSGRLLNDGGTGWHIRNGQQILAEHYVPRMEVFSATMFGKHWYAWEWLFDAGVGAIYNGAGLNGVVFATALAIALSFFLLFVFLRRRGAGIVVSTGFVVLALLASSVHFLARPHVLSWIFTVLWFEILDQWAESRERGRALLWLPLILLLWVNVHGSYVLGGVLLGIYALAETVSWLRAHDAPLKQASFERLQLLCVAGLGCGLASLANPYGYRLHLHVIGYLTNRFFMAHIQEFQSPDFHSPAGKAFIALLLTSAAGLVAARKWVRTEHAVVAGFAAASGLYAARNLPVASMLLALTAAPLLSRWWNEKPADGRLNAFLHKMSAMDAGLRWHIWPALAVLVGVWACAHQGRIGSRQVINAHFDAARFPVLAGDWLQNHEVRQPVFSTDAWGGYLIYRLYPQLKVVVDDRHDLYGPAFMQEYLTLLHAEPGWEAILNEWNANWVLLPPACALSSVLKERPDWQIVYDDGLAVIFHRG
jgi:hypothetical protein